MAFVYASTLIQKLNPRAVISFLPSDHFIKNPLDFKKSLDTAAALAKKHQKIVLLGSLPAFANPSYGYLLPNKKDKQHAPAFPVVNFVEKPDPKAINELIKNAYLWNLGIYTFSASVLFAEIKKYQPAYFSLYQKLQKHPDNPRLVNHVYTLSPALSIDYALAEKSKQLLVLPVNFIWSDVGEWKTIYQQLATDKQGFATLNPDTLFAQFDSQNCLLSARKNKLIGLVGVKDLTIIDTADALLVCQIQKSFHVRDLISKIVSSKKTKSFYVAKNDH